MQNKGFVKVFAVLLTLVGMFMLLFVFSQGANIGFFSLSNSN